MGGGRGLRGLLSIIEHVLFDLKYYVLKRLINIKQKPKEKFGPFSEKGRVNEAAGRDEVARCLEPREKYIVINLSSKMASRIHPVKEINLAAKAKDVGFTPHKGARCIILVGTRNV